MVLTPLISTYSQICTWIWLMMVSELKMFVTHASLLFDDCSWARVSDHHLASSRTVVLQSSIVTLFLLPNSMARRGSFRHWSSPKASLIFNDTASIELYPPCLRDALLL